METECLFCKIYKNKINIIFENNYFYAKFDEFPVTPGHTLIIPKKHTVSLLDLSDIEWQDLLPAIKEIKKIIESSDFKKIYSIFLKNPLNEKSKLFCEKILSSSFISKKPDGYNFGVNEGIAAGRTIHHLHIQIIPRFFGDVNDYIGGVRHVIPGVGNYK